MEGCRDAQAAERCSSCAVEVVAPWRSLACLSPDATQLSAGPSWGPQPFKWGFSCPCTEPYPMQRLLSCMNTHHSQRSFVTSLS